MHPHEALVREFYARFAARDAEGMAACYHPDVAFSDPVFPMLHGEEAADMWRMRLSRGAHRAPLRPLLLLAVGLAGAGPGGQGARLVRAPQVEGAPRCREKPG